MAANLENKVDMGIGQNLGLLQSLQTNPSSVGDSISQYALTNSALQKFSENLPRGSNFMDSFTNKLQEYSQNTATNSPYWRRIMSNYSLGNIKDKLGETVSGVRAGAASAAAGVADRVKKTKDFVYSVPGRMYPYITGALGKVKQGAHNLNPLNWPGMIASAAWGKVKKPLLLGVGAYVLYKTVKYFMNRKSEPDEVERYLMERGRARGAKNENYVTKQELEQLLQDVKMQNQMSGQQARIMNSQ